MKSFFDEFGVTIFNGDARAVLPTLPDQFVNCVATSPPYWSLRDYGVDGQIGLEKSPADYVVEMVAVFREVRRMLKDDGTLWLNLGDSYASAPVSGCKPKDLIGIPWMVAFALRADGWYLRSDIIWAKPNPMPESVTDRPTKSHEYLFLLSKSERYYYDADAIAEPLAESSIERLSQPTLAEQVGSFRVPGKTNGPMKAVAKRNGKAVTSPRKDGNPWNENNGRGFIPTSDNRNKRSVWSVATMPYSAAHFATFPPKLIEPCIKAGCPQGGVVLDPFFGSGTTGLVCQQQHVRCIGVELNKDYCAMAAKRCAQGVLFGAA